MPGPQIRLLNRARCWSRSDVRSGQPLTPSDTYATKHKQPKVREPYVRARDLPKLIGLWPSEIEDQTLAGHERLLKLLRRALRLERQRGLAGHWTYDLARHANLLKAYRYELASFRGDLAGGADSGRASPLVPVRTPGPTPAQEKCPL
jgi:hypothetical protein